MKVSPIKRVAVIFDNSIRPETTGLYCRRALGNLVEVGHFLPEELDQVPPGEFDLFLNVDDGLEYRLPETLRPAAYWAIDTHIEFERSRKKAEDFEFVFAAQRDGSEKLRQNGIDTAFWLPLACDPLIHHPYEVKKSYDVCFVGNLLPGPRTELLEQIQERFPRTFVGRRYFEQMAETFAASRIVFNRSVANDVNMRVFEALACGSLLVTNDLAANGQEELFQDGVHLATYFDAGELLETIEFYLKHDEPRERMALAGLSEVHSRHTYLHRMVQLLRRVEDGLSTTIVGVPEWEPVRKLQNLSSSEAPEQPQVSACLVSWKRPENVRRIVDQLQKEPLIDDIVVWNNNPQLQLDFNAENVTVIDSEQNLVTYGRYLATKHAKHDFIYTQDDDCLVHNIGELYDSFQREPNSLTHALKLGHLAHNAENFFAVPGLEASLLAEEGDQSAADDPSRPPQTQDGATAQMALVGWGAFFHRKWCDVFEKYITSFGEDELLHRKADRLFTLLLGKRHRSLPAEVTDLEGAEGEEALSVKSDHFELTRQAVERALTLLGAIQPSHQTCEIAEIKSETPTGIVDTIGATAAGAKDQSYFEFARPELLALVPQDTRRVLDVGCGAGKLGESIKQQQGAEVWGIERDHGAAALACERLDRVLTGDVEQLDTQIELASFDCIICGDILEHLREPDQFLKQARNWLTEAGRLVASIPNVRHHSVVGSLLAGNWTYESAGLLDQDHVRFFTRREIEKLFFRSGFRIDEFRIVPGSGFEEWRQSGHPGEVKAGRLNIAGLSPEEAEEFYVYQYLVTAVPEPTDLKTHQQLKEKNHEKDKPTINQSAHLERLSRDFPWPDRKPEVPIPTEDLGWLADGARKMLAAVLTQETQVVVELGAWLGLSTRFLSEKAPQATVISIDHWQGSPEHHKDPRWRERLPQLYETFQSLCWEQRQRIIPLKMTTQEGLQTLADYDLQPDLIYFDAEHSYHAVLADLELCGKLFPQAVLVGDDFDDPGVAKAVREYARLNGLEVQTAGKAWRAWKLQQRQPARLLPPPAERFPLTSIVIPTHNQLPYTKMCLDSIRQFTDEPYELIVVDNGSTDGTPEYLPTMSDVTLISNTQNLGFPKAVN